MIYCVGMLASQTTTSLSQCFYDIPYRIPSDSDSGVLYTAILVRKACRAISNLAAGEAYNPNRDRLRDAGACEILVSLLSAPGVTDSTFAEVVSNFIVRQCVLD